MRKDSSQKRNLGENECVKNEQRKTRRYGGTAGTPGDQEGMQGTEGGRKKRGGRGKERRRRPIPYCHRCKVRTEK